MSGSVSPSSTEPSASKNGSQLSGRRSTCSVSAPEKSFSPILPLNSDAPLSSFCTSSRPSSFPLRKLPANSTGSFSFGIGTSLR